MPRLDNMKTYEDSVATELRACWYVTLLRRRWRAARRIGDIRRRLECIRGQRRSAPGQPGGEGVPPELTGEWSELRDELVMRDWYQRAIAEEMARRPFWMTVGILASIVALLVASLLAWASGGK